MITLTETQVAQLEQFIQELPTKFGVPLLNLLKGFVQENTKKPEPTVEAE